jgi:L-aminopeptidase/D-esterase-like protein
LSVHLLVLTSAWAGPRARELGIPFEGQPGRYNAITDVPGVEVGHTTLIRGEGRMVSGQGPVRTGVTAILPRGKNSRTPSVASVFSFNGNGELTGSHWVNESGFLETPILLTNTHSVGVVRDAVVAWGNRRFPPHKIADEAFSLPVVGETYDGYLNDINGQHVRPEHVFAALDGARGGAVSEGNVGGGTGMMTSEWKGGIGTSSRIVSIRPNGQERQTYVIGVLVQANYGQRQDLRILGAPVGKEIPELMPVFAGQDAGAPRDKDGSIIVVIGTDAPLLPNQMARLVRRAALGLGRLGAISYQSSGDLFIAFGPAEPEPDSHGLLHFTALPNDAVDPLLRGVVQATEEAIINALVAAETMVGRDGNIVYALPHDRLLEVLRRHRLVPEKTR